MLWSCKHDYPSIVTKHKENIEKLVNILWVLENSEIPRISPLCAWTRGILEHMIEQSGFSMEVVPTIKLRKVR